MKMRLQPTQTTDESVRQKIEEITVMGARSLTLPRLAVIVAEDRFLDRNNVVNEDSRYDTICKHATHVGSHISSRECSPKIIRDLQPHG
jgi:hypothetical protein